MGEAFPLGNRSYRFSSPLVGHGGMAEGEVAGINIRIRKGVKVKTEIGKQAKWSRSRVALTPAD